MSRADARDTGAALLIRGDGALGVETPAHKEGQEAGRQERRAGEEQKERRGSEAGEGKREEKDRKNHGLTPETRGLLC